MGCMPKQFATTPYAKHGNRLYIGIAERKGSINGWLEESSSANFRATVYKTGKKL